MTGGENQAVSHLYSTVNTNSLERRTVFLLTIIFILGIENFGRLQWAFEPGS
jgi:hypothetical protein